MSRALALSEAERKSGGRSTLANLTRLATRIVATFEPRPLLLVVPIASAVRLLALNRQSFWLDEAFSVWYSRQPPEVLWASLDDPHPPLYYLLLHLWLQIGDSESWARLLSALLGIASIPLTYQIGRRLSDARFGAIAAGFLAVSPWHVWYSQEARMYAAVAFCGALSCLSAIRWLQKPSASFAVLYVTSTLAGLYVDYSLFFLWPAEALVWWAVHRKLVRPGQTLTWIALQACIALAYFWQWEHLRQVASGVASADFAAARFGSLSNYLGPALLGLVAGLALLGIVWGWRRKKRAPTVRECLTALLFLAWVGSVVVMLIPTGLTIKRVLVIWVPLICMGGAWALREQLWPALTARRLFFASTLVLVATVLLVPKQPWRDVVQHISANAQPGDIVLLEAGYMRIPFEYYNRGRLPSEGVSSGDLGSLPQLHESYRRVWLVLADERYVDADEQVLDWFAHNSSSPAREALDYPYIRLRLFDL